MNVKKINCVRATIPVAAAATRVQAPRMRLALHVTAPDGASLYRCTACDRLLPATHFYASNTKYRLHRCKRCATRAQRAYMAARRTSPYFRMLCTLRRHAGRSEHARRFQEADVAAVVRAFHGRSALSDKPAKRLVLVRWRPSAPLHPGNAVPLTSREAAAHRAVRCVEDAYPAAAVARTDTRLRQTQTAGSA